MYNTIKCTIAYAKERWNLPNPSHLWEQKVKKNMSRNRLTHHLQPPSPIFQIARAYAGKNNTERTRLLICFILALQAWLYSFMSNLWCDHTRQSWKPGKHASSCARLLPPTCIVQHAKFLACATNKDMLGKDKANTYQSALNNTTMICIQIKITFIHLHPSQHHSTWLHSCWNILELFKS